MAREGYWAVGDAGDECAVAAGKVLTTTRRNFKRKSESLTSWILGQTRITCGIQESYLAPATDINSSGLTSRRDLRKGKTARKNQDQEIKSSKDQDAQEFNNGPWPTLSRHFRPLATTLFTITKI